MRYRRVLTDGTCLANTMGRAASSISPNGSRWRTTSSLPHGRARRRAQISDAQGVARVSEPLGNRHSALAEPLSGRSAPTVQEAAYNDTDRSLTNAPRPVREPAIPDTFQLHSETARQVDDRSGVSIGRREMRTILVPAVFRQRTQNRAKRRKVTTGENPCQSWESARFACHAYPPDLDWQSRGRGFGSDRFTLVENQAADSGRLASPGWRASPSRNIGARWGMQQSTDWRPRHPNRS